LEQAGSAGAVADHDSIPLLTLESVAAFLYAPLPLPWPESGMKYMVQAGVPMCRTAFPSTRIRNEMHGLQDSGMKHMAFPSAFQAIG